MLFRSPELHKDAEIILESEKLAKFFEEPYWLTKKEFSEDKRKQLASEGEALPDGSFPIQNVSDLENAIQAFGRAKDKAKAKAHIISRARALGASDKIPESWGSNKASEGDIYLASKDGYYPLQRVTAAQAGKGNTAMETQTSTPALEKGLSAAVHIGKMKKAVSEFHDHMKAFHAGHLKKVLAGEATHAMHKEIGRAHV